MKQRKLDKRLFTILLIVFVQMVGASMIMPILPLYALRRFEMDPVVIPLLGTSFFIAQAIAGPYLGRMSDKYGRVPVLIVSQIGTVLSFLMIALAPNIIILFAARILDGITGGNIIVARAYITDITPKEKRTQSLGLIFAAFGLGFIFGPAVGGLLSAAFGATFPFFVAAAAATIVVVLTYFTLDESLTAEQREKNRQKSTSSLSPAHIITNYPLLLILLIIFVAQFVLGLLQSTFSLYSAAVLFAGNSDQATDLGIGLLLTAFGITQFITQLVILPRLLRKFSDPVIVVVGLIIRGVGSLIYVIALGPILGAAGTVAFAIGMGLLMPPLQSMSTRTIADELRGAVLGLGQSTVSVSTIFSTAVAGLLFDWDPTMPYQVSVILAIIALIPALLLIKVMPKNESTSPITAVTD